MFALGKNGSLTPRQSNDEQKSFFHDCRLVDGDAMRMMELMILK